VSEQEYALPENASSEEIYELINTLPLPSREPVAARCPTPQARRKSKREDGDKKGWRMRRRRRPDSSSEGRISHSAKGKRSLSADEPNFASNQPPVPPRGQSFSAPSPPPRCKNT